MNIKIIAGMFKVIECELTVGDDSIVIFGTTFNRRIKLSEVESISVTRQMTRASRLEINLADDNIEGIFYDNSDADAFADSIKDRMGSVLQVSFQ